MSAVAAQMNQPRRRHVTRDRAVGERKRQIETGRTFHVNGVQRFVGTHHAQCAILWYQQNVWNVAAVFLIQMAPLLRQIESFAAADVLEIDDRIGDSALRSHDQPLQVRGLLPVQIANLRVFGDGIFETMRHWSGPLYGSGNRSAIGYVDDFVAALCRGQADGGKEEGEKFGSRKQVLHTASPSRSVPAP